MHKLPVISGHAPGHLRDAFEEAIYEHDDVSLWKLTGKLWNCSDIMPGDVCNEADLLGGSTYAMYARHFRAMDLFSIVDTSGEAIYLPRSEFIKRLAAPRTRGRRPRVRK
jgi:hypothetical protein